MWRNWWAPCFRLACLFPTDLTVIFKTALIFFLLYNNAKRHDLNHLTYIILLLCCGGALLPKEVVPIEVFVGNLRPPLLLTSLSVLLKIQPATQMDTEKIHTFTDCHIHVSFQCITTIVHMVAHTRSSPHPASWSCRKDLKWRISWWWRNKESRR